MKHKKAYDMAFLFNKKYIDKYYINVYNYINNFLNKLDEKKIKSGRRIGVCFLS